jgi:hypothetical protein
MPSKAMPGGTRTKIGRNPRDRELPGAVHALFHQQIVGDDALLRLAEFRFAQMGLAAELYADTVGELERLLQFVPPHPCLPLVHLNRRLNVLHERSRAVVVEFASHFAGRRRRPGRP